MRPLLTLVLLALVAGCDASGTDPEPFGGVVEVALQATRDGRPALLLVAVGDTGCDDPLVVETDASEGRLAVRVIGIERPSGSTCLAIIPASALVPLPVQGQGAVDIGVTHRGSTDAYAYSNGFAGERLDAVRTSTTRLATP